MTWADFSIHLGVRLVSFTYSFVPENISDPLASNIVSGRSIYEQDTPLGLRTSRHELGREWEWRRDSWNRNSSSPDWEFASADEGRRGEPDRLTSPVSSMWLPFCANKRHSQDDGMNCSRRGIIREDEWRWEMNHGGWWILGDDESWVMMNLEWWWILRDDESWGMMNLEERSDDKHADMMVDQLMYRASWSCNDGVGIGVGVVDVSFNSGVDFPCICIVKTLSTER